MPAIRARHEFGIHRFFFARYFGELALKCWVSFLSLVVIVENERGFVFEAGRRDFFRHLSEGVLDESFLQKRLFALRPGAKNCISDRHRVAIFV